MKYQPLRNNLLVRRVSVAEVKTDSGLFLTQKAVEAQLPVGVVEEVGEEVSRCKKKQQVVYRLEDSAEIDDDYVIISEDLVLAVIV